MSISKEKRRQELAKSEKVIYLEEYKKIKNTDGMNIFYLKMVSLKYNQIREVLNKDTLESKGRLKEWSDGDKEYNHIVIVEKEREIKAAFEFNYYGLQSLGMVMSYLNDMAELYFKEAKEDKYYNFEAHNEINKDFLEELQKTDRISMVTLFVESTRLGNSDYGTFAERSEIKEEVEITFKRSKKKYMSKDIVEHYYNSLKEGKGIKRISLYGRKDNNKIKLDTEEMKRKEIISITENQYGEFDANTMFEKIKQVLLGE